MPTSPRFALVLSGGGARAAYQVGALRGIAMVLPKDARNPFQIISGTSAGGLNAASLATHAQRFRTAIRTLEYVWRNLDSSQVYRLDSSGLITSASNWVFSFMSSRTNRSSVSLLNNDPLEELLYSVLKLERIQSHLDAGFLETLSITASGYTSGDSVSFFQSNRKDLEDWRRPHRVGVRTNISIKHLMASTAIPTLFPAVKIDQEYFGDGAIRQLAPLSPAIHLGADRILAIGVSGSRTKRPEKHEQIQHPSLSQIIGHVLNSAFVDTLDSDMAVLRRYNAMLPHCSMGPDLGIRPIELLEITPSLDLNEIAADFIDHLPRAPRLFIKDTHSSSMLSLLLFEKAYCEALMDLGISDAMAQREQIRSFFRVPAQT